jgi:hypothetical protein
MRIKILMTAAAIMISLTAQGTSIDSAGQDDAFVASATQSSLPGIEQIRADLIGHRMYVSEGLPGMWEFSDPADIQRASIGSSRLHGASLVFNVTLILVDNDSPSRDTYRAETLITYKKTNETWALVDVQDISFRPAGPVYSFMTVNPDADC